MALIVAVLLAVVAAVAAVMLATSDNPPEKAEAPSQPTIQPRHKLPVPKRPITERIVLPPMDEPGAETRDVEPGETVTDITGVLSLAVPDGWTEAARETLGAGEFTMLAVSADVDTFLDDELAEPGFIAVLSPADGDDLDDTLMKSDVACDDSGPISDYRDDDFRGRTVSFAGCDNGFTVQVVAVDAGDGMTLSMGISLTAADSITDYTSLFESVELGPE